MLVVLTAELVDVFDKGWEVDGKSGTSYKFALMNDAFFSDRDRIVNVPMTEELYKRMNITQDPTVLSKLKGKTFNFYCNVRVQDKGFKLICHDFVPAKAVEKPKES